MGNINREPGSRTRFTLALKSTHIEVWCVHDKKCIHEEFGRISKIWDFLVVFFVGGIHLSLCKCVGACKYVWMHVESSLSVLYACGELTPRLVHGGMLSP